MKHALLVLVLLILGTVTAPAKANAQICSATVSAIDFGSPVLLDGNAVDATGTISVTCTSIPLLSVVKICPGIPAGSGGTDVSARLMTSPSGSLRYQLYQDAARTQPWGSIANPALGSVPGMVLAGSLAGAGTITRPVYGRLLGAQTTAPADQYRSDFLGNATSFVYGAVLLGASTDCTGFVGTGTLYPTFSVTATPARSCTIAATDLAFPAVGVLAAPVAAQSRITLTCTAQTLWAVALDAGRNPDAASTRRMKGPSGGLIAYGLYGNAGLSVRWGSGAQAVSGTGTGSAQRITVYGQVPVQRAANPGAYVDTVVATIIY